MKLIANGLNKAFFRSILPPAETEIDGVVAAIAYGDDKTPLLEHCLKNHHRLDIWMRYDHTVPVAPSFLSKLLFHTRNNIFCKLVPDCLHSKVIWWKGYGAYIGSANLTDRAWNINIEAGVFFSESDLYNSDLILQIEGFFDNLASLDCCIDLSQEIIDEQRQLQKLNKEKDKKEEIIRKRIVPVWGGVSNYEKPKANDKRKDSFHKEWDSTLTVIKNISRVFRILCHVKNSIVSSHYSAALQNKWLTATMSNSSSEWALSIFPVHSSDPDKVASEDCFHWGKHLWFWSTS